MRETRTPRRSLALALVALLSVPWLSRAGEYHAPDNNNCSDCHTTHNSRGGAPMRYDAQAQPSTALLRAGDPDQLCIHCHDGSVENVPDVVEPVDDTASPSGGAFPAAWSEKTDPGRAHVVGGSALTPPGGAQPMKLSCINCHDPHGNGSFRSLKKDPAGTGADLTVVATDVVASTRSNAAVVYASGNTRYVSGMSAWCGSCHGSFHTAAGASAPWLVHPQDRTLATSPHADFAAWSGTVANRIRVQNPAGEDSPSPADQVFCLSCHRAHGSPRRAALVWADGSTQDSTCTQCHDK